MSLSQSKEERNKNIVRKQLEYIIYLHKDPRSPYSYSNQAFIKLKHISNLHRRFKNLYSNSMEKKMEK